MIYNVYVVLTNLLQQVHLAHHAGFSLFLDKENTVDGENAQTETHYSVESRQPTIRAASLTPQLSSKELYDF